MEPFVRLAFFSLFYSYFWPNLRPNSVRRPTVVLLVGLCFAGIWAVLGSGGPNPPFVLSDTQSDPFYTPKTLGFEGNVQF